MAVPSDSLDRRERSRAQITIILFMILLAVLFVELFSTPYVVTVYSKGCWSVDTNGLLNHFNTRGCGTQSWLIVDLYAHISGQPVVNGANDASLFLTTGAGPGGGCIGGSACALNNLWTYAPQSPVACSGCVVTQLGLSNPLAGWSGANFASFPLVTWILLIYLAKAIRNTPRVYSGFLKNERTSLDWKDLPRNRKTLAIFALGYLALTTYQYAATWVYVLIRPVPTLNFPFSGLLLIPVAVWLARLQGWKFPVKILPYQNIVRETR